jgi:mannose-6-phosphate isomerase-like protein (cupin superfamily)
VKIYNLNDFIKGWIIGDFEPSIVRTKDFEVSIKEYKAGDKESAHTHKLADEYTCIASGAVLMNGTTYKKNDIIHIAKGESTDFTAITDVITVVIKMPSVMGDKYPT